MVAIAQELVDFKTNVGSQLGAMNSKCTELSSMLQEANSACNSAKTGFSNGYNSENKNIVLGTFDTINSYYSTIGSSVNGTLKPILNDSSSLIDDITKLENLKKVIEDNQSVVNNNSDNTDDAISRRATAQSTINEKTTEFNSLHATALEKLNKLKSISDDLGDFANESNNNGVEGIETNGGTLQEASYVASNGVRVSYYIYIPNTDSTEKLPMMLYFHGVQDTIQRHPDSGLAGLISSGQVQPKGIVIFPQATNGTKDLDFDSATYEKAVLELTGKVAEQYNGDMNKLSVSGHSNGGTAAYKIVNNFPGTFAACAPIAGVGNTDKGVMQTNLWAFQGSNDGMVTPSTGLRVAIKCQKMGLNSRYFVYSGKGHEIQTMTFQDTFEDENGQPVKLIDWLMSKSLT